MGLPGMRPGIITVHGGLPVQERKRMGNNMRLIDADELRKKFVDFEFVDGVWCNADSYTLNAINKAPTVDAVPIEWIKMRIKGLRGQLANADEDDKDLIWDLRTKIDELSGIAEYWRKYHETD